jgi:P27 family predicted phage terminase small subunit
MRGRKPIPTKLKLLRGNPGKRALNKCEPQPDLKIPDCPDHLDAEAKVEWARMCKVLFAQGLLTDMDRAALAAYCQDWSRWVRAERMVLATGEVLKGDNGLYQNPYLAVANRAQLDMRNLLVEFGMTPSSRTRLQITPQTEEDPFERFLREKTS